MPASRDRWAKWFKSPDDRVLFQTTIGPRRVSTIFIGLDHSFTGNMPLLWETAMFEGKDDLPIEITRHATYDQALAAHTQTVIELQERYGGESK
jgi:hypothetical protein